MVCRRKQDSVSILSGTSIINQYSPLIMQMLGPCCPACDCHFHEPCHKAFSGRKQDCNLGIQSRVAGQQGLGWSIGCDCGCTNPGSQGMSSYGLHTISKSWLFLIDWVIPSVCRVLWMHARRIQHGEIPEADSTLERTLGNLPQDARTSSETLRGISSHQISDCHAVLIIFTGPGALHLACWLQVQPDYYPTQGWSYKRYIMESLWL